MKYGVFTVSMPEYDVEETAKILSDLGYDGVEWRVFDVIDPSKALDEKAAKSLERFGFDPKSADLAESLSTLHDPTNPRYPLRYWVYNKSTLDINNIAEEARRAKEICDRYGLEIFGLTGYIGTENMEKLGELFAAAGEIGTPLVRVGLVNFNSMTSEKTYPEAFESMRNDLKKIEQLAAEHGVKAVIELHHDTLTPSPSAAIRALEGLNPEHIGVTFDPGNMVYEGFENYLDGFQILGDYLAHVHLKNAALVPGERNELGAVEYTREWKPLKEGSANLLTFFKALHRIGYDKLVSIEDFSNEQTTEEKLREGIEYIRALEEASEAE